MKIIENGGKNDFLAGVDGGIASNVRKDFEATHRGNRRKDGKHIEFVPTKEEEGCRKGYW